MLNELSCNEMHDKLAFLIYFRSMTNTRLKVETIEDEVSSESDTNQSSGEDTRPGDRLFFNDSTDSPF